MIFDIDNPKFDPKAAFDSFKERLEIAGFTNRVDIRELAIWIVSFVNDGRWSNQTWNARVDQVVESGQCELLMLIWEKMGLIEKDKWRDHFVVTGMAEPDVYLGELTHSG